MSNDGVLCLLLKLKDNVSPVFVPQLLDPFVGDQRSVLFIRRVDQCFHVVGLGGGNTRDGHKPPNDFNEEPTHMNHRSIQSRPVGLCWHFRVVDAVQVVRQNLHRLPVVFAL